RTQLVNSVRGWMRSNLLTCSARSRSTFVQAVRRAALASPQGLPEFIKHQLEVIEALSERIAEADAQLKELATEHPVCQRLMTIPGVGPVTALRFVAAIDDPSRFTSAHRVQSYVGLTPGEHSSSERERRTGITKAGPQELRCCLVQAAWVATRVHATHPMIEW